MVNASLSGALTSVHRAASGHSQHPYVWWCSGAAPSRSRLLTSAPSPLSLPAQAGAARPGKQARTPTAGTPGSRAVPGWAAAQPYPVHFTAKLMQAAAEHVGVTLDTPARKFTEVGAAPAARLPLLPLR